jgi:hypothetical protein
MGREQDYRHFREDFLKNGSGLCPIHPGHREIQENDIGRGFLGLLNSFQAIFCFSTHGELIVFDRQSQYGTHRWVVIDNEDPSLAHTKAFEEEGILSAPFNGWNTAIPVEKLVRYPVRKNPVAFTGSRF